MTERPVLFGAAYSVYVRIVRLTLAEKGVDHDHVPIDVFGKDGLSGDFRERHPFGRIPAFEHGAFSLYETSAITRYVDEAFEGPPLQPSDVRARARCNQLVSIADNYAYSNLVWGLYVETTSKPKRGDVPDAEKVVASRRAGEICLAAISKLLGNGRWLAGNDLTLADLYVAPMVDYLLRAPVGEEMLAQNDNLHRWWARMSERPSMIATSFDP